ncbi:hypothetical protein V8E36_005029 [Tilletia maclaganii]
MATTSAAMLPAFYALTKSQQPSASLPLPPPPPPTTLTSLPASPPSTLTPSQSQQQQLKLTKKLNARLQLAAALIEADNEAIIQQAEAQSKALRSSTKEGGDADQGPTLPSSKKSFLWLPSPRLLQQGDGDQDETQAQDEPTIGPSPLPQPRLASQSVIFAPFRDTLLPSIQEQRAQKALLADRLSRLDQAAAAASTNDSPAMHTEATFGRRSSIDFLGVTLPADRRARTRSNSLGSLSQQQQLESTDSGMRPRSRLSTVSADTAEVPLGAAAGDDEEDADALSDWGVDKFLTSTERERVQNARQSHIRTLSDSSSRPLSALGNVPPTADPSPGVNSDQTFAGLRNSHLSSPAGTPSLHARSEFATEATGIPTTASLAGPEQQQQYGEDPSGFPVPRYRRNHNNKSAKPADLELLARIKMYRERQEVLPPSQWNGPGPHASEQDVKDHIMQSPSKTQTALGGGEPSGSEQREMSAAGSAAARLLDDLAAESPHQRLLTLSTDGAALQKPGDDDEELLRTPNPASASASNKRASTSSFSFAGLNLRTFARRKSSLDMIKHQLASGIPESGGDQPIPSPAGVAGTEMTPSASASTMMTTTTTTGQCVHGGVVDSQRPRLLRIESTGSEPSDVGAAFSSLIGSLRPASRTSETDRIHTRDASHRSTLTQRGGAGAAKDSSDAGGGAAESAGASITRPASSFGVVCDSWSEQGEQETQLGDSEEEDDVPLGQIQQARLSRTASQMRKAAARMSVLSDAETIRSAGRGQPERAVHRVLEDPSAESFASAGGGSFAQQQRQIPVRKLSRSTSEDALRLLDFARPALAPLQGGPAGQQRPFSTLLPSTSQNANSTMNQAALAAGLPFPSRPFAGVGAGSGIPRPRSVGPGTLLSSDLAGAVLDDGDEYRVEGVLSEGARIVEDPYNAFSLGPSPFPAAFSPMNSPRVMRGGDLPPTGASSPAGISPHLRGNKSLAPLDASAQGSLTTKQLQALARQQGGAFPSSFGISTPGIDEFSSRGHGNDLEVDDDPLSPGGGADAGIHGVMDLGTRSAAAARGKTQARPQTGESSSFGGGGGAEEGGEGSGIMSKLRKRRSRSSSLVLDQMGRLVGADGEPIVPSEDRPAEPIVRQNGRIVLTAPSTTASPLAANLSLHTPRPSEGRWEPGLDAKLMSFTPSADTSAPLASWGSAPLPGAVRPPTAPRRQSVDDTFTSPPTKGPLKPLGLAAREPKALIMPAPLQGSESAPQLRLTHNGVEIQFELTPPPATAPAQSRDVLEAAAADALAAADAFGGKGEKKSLFKKKDKEKEKQKKSDVPPETLVGPRAPDGFVLHDVRGTAPLRALLVHSAAPAGVQIQRPTLAAKPKKHDVALADFLTSDGAARIVRVPATAPAGIGRRAADKSTILFRNQLVQHEEERDGWGWDAASTSFVDADGNPALEPVSKKTRAERRAEKKALKLKRRRKKLRRERRALRARADEEGKSYADFGVEAESPVEDLDLSSDSTLSESSGEEGSESEDYDSDDEKRWLDANRPAGKLFGKSLLDVAEEQRGKITKKSRFYGQVELEETEALEHEAERLGVTLDVLSSRSAARSFRENPMGYNDTRERMQAAFGEDKNWAREATKRAAEDMREAEERELKRLAEEEFQKAEKERKERKKAKKAGRKGAPEPVKKKEAPTQRDSPVVPAPDTHDDAENGVAEDERDDDPPRSRTPIEPPTINLDFNVLDDDTPARKNRRKNGATTTTTTAAEWFATNSDDEDGFGTSEESSSSEDEATRRKAALQRARLSRSLGGLGQGRISFAFGEEDSDDDGGRQKGASAGAPLGDAMAVINRNAAAEDDSSEDDMPLAQIKQSLPLRTFADGLQIRPGGGALSRGDDSSDEDLPLAAIKAKEHRKKMSMGTLDLDFMAGPSGLQQSPNSGPLQGSQPSSSGTSPHVGQSLSGSLPTGSWYQQSTFPRIPSGLAHQVTPAAPPSDEDSDEDRPLGAVYANGAEALAVARATHAASDGEDEEDNRPLGAAYPQAAIIAEQAALIQQLQRQNEQVRGMANSMSMYGPMLGMGMGMSPMIGQPSMGMGMGMGMSPSMGMGGMGMMSVPPAPASVFGGGAHSVISGHGDLGSMAHAGPSAGMHHALTSSPSMPTLLGPGGAGLMHHSHPKVHQIDNWRHSVQPDAPSNQNSGTNSPALSATRRT